MPLPYHVRLLYSHFDGQDPQAPVGSLPPPHVVRRLPVCVSRSMFARLALCRRTRMGCEVPWRMRPLHARKPSGARHARVQGSQGSRACC